MLEAELTRFEEDLDLDEPGVNLWWETALVVVGVVGLALGAKWLVESARELAMLFTQ